MTDTVEFLRRWYDRHEEEIEPRQRARFRGLLMGPVVSADISWDERGMLAVIWRLTVRRAFCIVRDASHPERIHILEVPPETASCTGGLAWKAAMTEEQYRKLKIEA